MTLRQHSRSAQLRLVADPPPAHVADPESDPTRAVFEHWVWMLGRQAARCKLGPTRRAAINGALTLYSAAELMLAVEGLAADPFEGAAPHVAEAMRELEWLLRSEARIERFARQGEALRQKAAQAEIRARERAAQPANQADDEHAAATGQESRARLQALAARMREGVR